MLIPDLFKETFFAISANKARSGLTILGIVIGIGSVIAMISIGQGAAGSIQENIQSMGSNLITVSPGFQRSFSQVRGERGSAQTLTMNDAEAILEVSGVKATAPQLSSRYQLVYKGNNTNTRVVGTVEDYLSVRNVSMGSGSFISEMNNESISKVVVLGPTVRDDLFGEGVDPVGKTIKINKINFKVIGVTESKGSSGMDSQDDMVFIPITTMQKFLVGSEYVSTVSVQAESEKTMDLVVANITDLLLFEHNIDDPDSADFTVQSQEDIIESASSITNTMTILLAAIAGISLIVGGIGIMNMMMTTVTERTREIGLRKAVGAKRLDISLQFLTEAVMLTFIGGVFGIILGSGIAYGITLFSDTATKISLFSILLAFGVSAGIGIGFGYWPAQKAAKLNPIEALRYE
jgi:putative ABC transport system permease protein